MARVLLGVSGGVAAYKAVELCRLLIKDGHAVRVAMTPAAERFVGRATFAGITGAPVLIDEFEHDAAAGAYPGDPRPEHDPISHLALAEGAELMLVAPASANTLAKLAAGICDGMLTTSFLTARCPRLVAPAMNDAMWEAEATRANVETLRGRGVEVVEPEVGELASWGEYGAGRLPDPASLAAAAGRALGGAEGKLSGRRVLVTAGGTREAIDPVRFVGNRSSGRMGLALAGAAARLGADVRLIAANVALPTPPGVERIDVESAAELAEATASAFETCDLLLMVAAVADFRPREPARQKLVRESGVAPTLELEATEDILAGLSSRRRAGQVVVGFAAEHGGEFVERARAKLARKGADAIVVNDVSDPQIGFESDRNEVTVITPAAEHRLERAGKDEIAEALLELIGDLEPAA